MSGADTPTEAGDGAEEAQPTFLKGIEFLVGDDPNFGSFLLVVGIVTCMFIAAFQLALPAPVSHLLTAGVLFVTILTAVIASVLETLGYFDQDRPTVNAKPVDTTPAGQAKPWVPTGGTSAALPPLLNFDAELRKFQALFDGELPSQFDAFIEDYLRLKTSSSNRRTIASDLRADLNPVGVLFEEGSEGDLIYEDISERLFRYIADDAAGHLDVDALTFTGPDGTQADVSDLENEVSQMAIRIDNQGEMVNVEVEVRFYDADGAALASSTHPVGKVRSGASLTHETDVYIPADTDHADTTLLVSESSPDAAGA